MSQNHSFPRERIVSKSSWLPVSLILLAAAVVLQQFPSRESQAQVAGQPKVVAWEYKIVRATEDTLNELGAQGWEVVAAVGDVKGQSAGMRAINTIERAILKRPKAN